MESYQCDAVVIGAGAVGLAIARKLAQAGHDVIMLEKNAHFGMETSARNSEVIHAGIYYPHRLAEGAAVRARQASCCIEFCESHGVPHKRMGKLIVAPCRPGGQLWRPSPRRRADNDVDDLQPLDGAASRRWSRRSTADTACSRPPPASSTAINICWRCWATLTLVRDAEVIGGAARDGDGWHADRDAMAAKTSRWRRGIVVNAAGLWAQDVARAHRGPGAMCRRCIWPRAIMPPCRSRARSAIWSIRCRSRAGWACM